jgi:hypothetical protein
VAARGRKGEEEFECEVSPELRKKRVRRRPDASEPDAAGVLRPPVDLGLGAGLWRGRTAEGRREEKAEGRGGRGG